MRFDYHSTTSFMFTVLKDRQMIIRLLHLALPMPVALYLRARHLFTKERHFHDKLIWICRNSSCDARVHTANGEIVEWQNPIHRQPVVPWKRSRGYWQPRRCVLLILQSPSSILSEIQHILHQSRSRLAHLKPTVDTIKRTLRRV